MNTPVLSPESVRKREQLTELRKEYASLYAEKDYLLSQERESLYVRYLNSVGQEYYRLFCLSVEVSELKLKVQLAQATINRDECPDQSLIEQRVKEQMSHYYEQIRQRAQELEEAKHATVISTETVAELKQLYRMLVKRLHPDLHPHQSDFLNDLFLQVQTAYRTQNLDLLRRITLRMEAEESNEDDKLLTTENIDAYIESVQQQIEALKNEIEHLLQEFPFTFRQLLDDPEWIAGELRSVEEQYLQLEKEKAIYEERYQLIVE
jgi:hypothetical protein